MGHRVVRSWAVVVSAVAVVAALAGCSGAMTAATSAEPESTGSTSPATAPSAPAPTSTPVAVDPADYMISPQQMSEQAGDSGLTVASFDAGRGLMHCGIYSNWWTSDHTSPARIRMFGCRMESGYTFTYPQVDNPGGVGGCPSGFTVTGDAAPSVLCNSGLVFFSELQTSKTLPAGASLTFDDVTCTGTLQGVRCVAADSGHGFELSPSAYQLF